MRAVRKGEKKRAGIFMWASLIERCSMGFERVAISWIVVKKYICTPLEHCQTRDSSVLRLSWELIFITINE